MPKIQLNPEKFKKSLQKKKRNSFHIETGDNLAILKRLNPNQFDAMVTDPPAGISFMGKDWDGDKGSRDEWIRWLATTMAECMRVLKPGAHALVWCIPRTQHWTMMALENAGFIVRDVVYHLYGQGFPKSQDISKAIDKQAGAEREIVGQNPNVARSAKSKLEGSDYGGFTKVSADITAPATPEAKKWEGWGSALKPACEPWILVQKPISEDTIASNVLKHGTGGLNIDSARIETTDNLNGGAYAKSGTERDDGWGMQRGGAGEFNQPTGRFPANVILGEDAAQALDEQSGQLSQCGGPKKTTHSDGMFGIGTPGRVYKEENRGASRFFYTAKASKAEKNAGLEGMPVKQTTGGGGLTDVGDKFGAIKAPAQNFHPTVKPISLMKYLITLITPPGGTVLDPFMGSGTTGVAAIKNGFKFFGIDQDKQYSEIAMKRLLAVYRVDPKAFRTVKAQ